MRRGRSVCAPDLAYGPNDGAGPSDNMLKRYGADILGAAVVGHVAVIAHDEDIALRHGVAAVDGAFGAYEPRYPSVPIPGIFGLVELDVVNIDIAVLDCDRLAAKGNNTLDKPLGAVRKAYDNDIAALWLGKPIADLFNQNALIVHERADHGFAVDIGRLCDEDTQHEHRQHNAAKLQCKMDINRAAKALIAGKEPIRSIAEPGKLLAAYILVSAARRQAADIIITVVVAQI